MNEQIAVLNRLTGLAKPAIVLAGVNTSSRTRFLERMSRFANELQGTKPKSSAAVVVFLWLSELVSDEDALEVLVELPAGEQWADIVLAWTPEERRAALEQLEANGWTQETLNAL